MPAYDWRSEARHSVAVNGTTEFPEPIGLAATFDTPRIHEMEMVIGTEGRIKQAPRRARRHSNIFEGLDSGRRTLTSRHFVDISKHDEVATYLPVFRAAIVEGHAGSVMCAYDAINSQPACASQFLLQHTLRGAWQFQGYVVSDCGAVRDIFDGHRYRPTHLKLRRSR